ncbi:hypothetical protein BJX99DRAFT_252065 [Aspergillus californicus]
MEFILLSYGLSRSRTPTPDYPLRLESARNRAIQEAKGEIGEIPQGAINEQLISLLEPLRELDRTSAIAREILTTRELSSTLLQRRGDMVNPCRQCKIRSPWKTCVVFPVYNAQSMWSHACSTCTFYHKGNECSHRQAFEDQGGRLWDLLITDTIIARGGLRSVLAEEPNSATSINTTTFNKGKINTAAPKKRKEPSKSYVDNFPTGVGKTPVKDSAMPMEATPKQLCLTAGRSEPKFPIDGQVLPWPVPASAWNDPTQLRCMISVFKHFARIAESRVTELE